MRSWPKSVREIYEMPGNWDTEVIPADLGRELNKVLRELLAAALAAEEGDGFYWMETYNPSAQAALENAQSALARYERAVGK